MVILNDIFSINAKYVDEGRNHTKTLAIRDTQDQHSSKFLIRLVKDVLHDCGLQKDHVLCIVTYNASNMVSMVKKLNKRPRDGSSTTEESAAKIHEKSGASHSNQLIVCDDSTVINFYH